MNKNLGSRIFLAAAALGVSVGALRAQAEPGEPRGQLRPTIAGLYVAEEHNLAYVILRQGDRAELMSCAVAQESRMENGRLVHRDALPGKGESAKLPAYIAAYCNPGVAAYDKNGKTYLYAPNGERTRVVFDYAGTNAFTSSQGKYELMTDTGTLSHDLTGDGRSVAGWTPILITNVRVTNAIEESAAQISSSRSVAELRAYTKIDYPVIRE